MSPVSSSLRVEFHADQSTLIDLGTAPTVRNLVKTYALGDGSAAMQADRLYVDKNTLTPSQALDIDLAGGGLLDPFGAAISFARIKGIIIGADAANANNLVIGGDANAFASWLGAVTHTLTIRPGGVLALFCTDATAYVVTPGTGDILQIANGAGGTSVGYDLALLGVSV